MLGAFATQICIAPVKTCKLVLQLFPLKHGLQHIGAQYMISNLYLGSVYQIFSVNKAIIVDGMAAGA